VPEETAARLAVVREAFARQAERFDRYAAEADANTRERFAAALGPAATGRILDVACGTGVVTAALAPGAAEIVGVDASADMLARARARCDGIGNAGFRTADAEDLPFPDGAFDGVVSRLAVHHFARPERVVAGIARVLRPGGRSVIVDVVAPEDQDRARLMNAIEALRDPSHVRMLPPSGLDRLIEAAGLRILAVQTWEKTRDAGEWLGIAAGDRAGPLLTVLGAMAEAAIDAGLGLAIEDGRVTLVHRWRLVAAEKPAEQPAEAAG
jgi:ubiquinone/menaquinone biosynthesis C-methylase UbiE